MATETGKPHQGVVVDFDNRCCECDCAQPKNRQGALHSLECSKHQEDICLTCANLDWMSGNASH